MTRCSTALLLLGSLSGCATLGGTVKGDFACRAPTGTCAPMTEIDAKAVTALSGSNSGPSAVTPARQPAVSRGGGMGPRTGERLLAILLPAHVDAAGVLHDAATVHVVVEAPGWRLESSRPDPDTQSLPEFSRSSAPSSLREAVAGASAPAIDGLEMLPARAPHMITDGPPVPADAGPAPTAAAIAAARSGHRIADRSTSLAAHGAAQPGALPRGKTIVPTGDTAAALARVRGLAAPVMPTPAKPPTGTHPDVDLGDPFGAIPEQEKRP